MVGACFQLLSPTKEFFFVCPIRGTLKDSMYSLKTEGFSKLQGSTLAPLYHRLFRIYVKMLHVEPQRILGFIPLEKPLKILRKSSNLIAFNRL